MIKKYSLVLIAFLCFVVSSYGQVATIDFETNLAGYSHTPSQIPATDPGDQYFHRAMPSDLDIYEGSVGPYTNVTGSFLFVGSNPNTINSGNPGVITLNPINVSVFSNLELSIDWGAVPNDWDVADEIKVEYNFDNTAWTTLYGFDSNDTNQPLALIGNNNGGSNTANGTILTYALQTIISDNFSGSGTNLNLRIVCDSGANYEAFGLDNIVLNGTPIGSTETITVNQATGGEITPGTTNVVTGNDQSFAATADPCYTFSYWNIDSANDNTETTNPYTFTNVTSDHTITAVYLADGPYDISATAGANGIISPNGITSVACGANQTYTITPNGGYAIEDVLVDGLSVGALTSYTFNNVTTTHTISATFIVDNSPCIDEDFSSFTDWTDNGTGTDNIATHAGNSIPCRAFENGDSMISPPVNNPNLLEFFQDASGGGNGNTATVDYRIGAGAWVTFHSFNVTTAGNTESIPLTNLGGVDLSTQNNVTFRFNSTFSTWYLDDVVVTCGISGPEIEVQGNSIEIVDGDNTPDNSDDTDFGNIEVNGGTQINTFTILNTGGADLTVNGISSSNATEFSIGGTTSGTISSGNSMSFTITFDPNTTGNRMSTIEIDNDDGDEGTYDFVVLGNGTNSSSSDILTDASFPYTSNIDYTLYQVASITNTGQSVGVFRFDIRDGGVAANDSDTLGTELNDITFNVVNNDNIRSAALFNGNALVSNSTVIGANTITFSGLSGANVTAPDDGTATLTLRVTFLTAVTDNDQLQFTIGSAIANSSDSTFGASDAGGATSSIINNRNRIEVTADRLFFTQQPSDTSANAAMSPDVQVSGTDINNNIDLDWSGDVSLSSTGTMTGEPITVLATNVLGGIATFTNIIHTVDGTGLTLNATSSGLISATSNPFLITTFNFLAGDFRPLFATDLSFNGQWEYFNGAAWVAVPDGNAPQNTSVTITRILIDEPVTGGGNTSNNYDCDILILNGGTLEFFDEAIVPSAEFLSNGNTLEVQAGGELVIGGDIDLNSGTNLIIRDGAKMTIDQNSINNEHPIWDGVEKFEGGSMLEINDWDWGASPTQRSLVNISTAITDNDNGFKFGNVYFNPTNLTDNWTIIGGPININVTENDFEINNNSSFYVLGMSNSAANISSTYGGDILISDGSFSFGGSFSNDTFDQNILVRGNVTVNSDDDFYIHRTYLNTPIIIAGSAPVLIEGNLEITSSVNNITSDVSTKEIVFSGDNSHTIEVAPNCSNTPFIVESGDTLTLLNENLKFTGNSGLEIENGATFNFSFNAGGTGMTALEVQSLSGGGNTFDQNSNSYIFITHPQGIWDSGSNGNAQGFAASNTTYGQTNSTYHYIGKTNQETGDAFTNGSTSKTIISELLNNTNELTVTETTGISNLLDIRSGIVVNTDANHIFGSGDLTISNGGLRSSVLSSTSTVPSLEGTYNLTGGFIQLNAAGDQVLRGSEDYLDLFFSVSGTKTITSAIPNITGTITTENAAILDVENKSMGGGLGTNLTMTGTSQYRTAGTGTKPDAQGTYVLNPNTKIVFTNNEASLESIRLNEAPYANIDIEGLSVGTNSLATGIRLQAGGTFTVKNTGIFKQSNTNGFSGGPGTSIDNVIPPTIILESGSTVEYTGANQFLTDFNTNADSTNDYYANLNISGSGTKTIPSTANGITINENLNVLSSSLLVDNSKYIEVFEDAVIDGDITVEKEAAFVQRGSGIAGSGTSGSFTNNGTSIVNKTTSDFNDSNLHYTYWSSPVVTGNPYTLFPNADGDRRYYYEAANFLDVEIEINNNNATTVGHDDIDDNGDDWQVIENLANPNVLIPGRGFAITATAPPTVPMPFPYNNSVAFTGAFNTGDISIAIEHNGNNGDNDWNFIGNPYPGAIDFTDLYTNNNTVIDGCAFLWSHASIPENTNNGNEVINFNQDDYAIINLTGCTAGGSQVIPDPFIPSGQGFFVKGLSNGNLTFTNSVRIADATSNSQFFEVNNLTSLDETDTIIEPNKLWLNLKSDSNVFNQILVGYIQGATNEYDGFKYDAPRNLSTTNLSNIYTFIADDERNFAIQGKNINNLTIDEVISVGFKTSIDIATVYSFSIPQIEGIFMNENPIYLKDNLLNTYHNLKESDYNFTSEVGEFNNRFEIVFNQEALSLGDNKLDDKSLTIIEHNSGKVEFKVSNNLQISTIEIIDITGKSIYNFKVNKGESTIYNLSALNQAAYIAKVGLDDGRTITRKAIKQK